MEGKLQPKKPAPNELAIAQVTKITRFGAYCKLLEYDGVEVFIPIREVSSGWIKNIHEYLHQGQNIVCKITYIDNQKGTIDASIKKVMPRQAKEKLSVYNLEKKVAVLVQKILKSLNEEKQKDKVISTIFSEFGGYAQMYQNLVENTEQFDNSKLPKKIKTALQDFVKENEAKKTHKVSYILKILNEETENGITTINNALSDAEKSNVEVYYLSAPNYRITAEGKTYQESEQKIKRAINTIKAEMKGVDISVEKEKLKRDTENVMDNI